MGRYVFKLPDVGEGTAEAELVAWHVKVGDMVAEDQIIADIMTDKATVELTSPVAGKVLAAHGEPGQQLAVGSPLVEFEVEGAGNAAGAEAPPPSNPAPQASVPLTGGQSAPQSPPTGGSTREAGEGAPAAAQAGNFVFKLPDVGEGTAEAELVGWHVKVGDAVTEDQLLAEVMTDKATVELTSPVAGTVVALHGETGQQLAVGGPLVSFLVEGKGNQAAAPAPAAPAPAPKAEAAPAPVAKAAAPAPAKAPARAVAEAFTTRAAGQRPLASPAVRQRARDLGVELQFVPGSGPAGRIEHGDLDAYVSSGGHTPSAPGSSTASAYERHEGTTVTRIIGVRRKIAEKMAESVR
ncbi:MAG: E3 binding domain-containing protein, partial [Alphaproteobacteria bacterium]|nr:E3 binding domain-containing protein [Alphaproteobacteria bacterium]